MIRLAADENLDRNIVKGLRRKIPGLDIVRVQEAGLLSADDPALVIYKAGATPEEIAEDLPAL